GQEPSRSRDGGAADLHWTANIAISLNVSGGFTMREGDERCFGTLTAAMLSCVRADTPHDAFTRRHRRVGRTGRGLRRPEVTVAAAGPPALLRKRPSAAAGTKGRPRGSERDMPPRVAIPRSSPSAA